MLMIVGQHFVRGAEIGGFGNWVANQPISPNKFVYQVIFMGGGWVGDFIFFVISVWFLVDTEQTLKSSLRRVWLMERQLLFWSLLLLAVSFGLDRMGWIHRNMLSLTAASIFPLSLNLWWYATSYALFLLFLPFLVRGIRTLNQKQHKTLAILMLVLWGFLGLIPHIEFNLTTGNVFVFIYWFVLITYYKWYMNKIKPRQCWILIATGISINILYWLATNLLFLATGRFASIQNFPFDHWFLASMMIGFGFFSLAEMHDWHSPIVNFLAGSAFGVYLIHTYWSIPAIWNRFASIRIAYTNKTPILFGVCAIFSIFVICLLLDVIRQAIFHFTCDRHKGAWFDKLFQWAHARISRKSNSGE